MAVEILRGVAEHGCPRTLGGPPAHGSIHAALAHHLGRPELWPGALLGEPGEHAQLHERIAAAILEQHPDTPAPSSIPAPLDSWYIASHQWHSQRHEWEARALTR